MASTSTSTTNPVLEFPRRKRTRSNLSVFTLPTSLAKRPHIEEISEASSSAPIAAALAPMEGRVQDPQSETESSSSSESSDEEEEEDVSEGISSDSEGSAEIDEGISESGSEETSSSSSSSSSGSMSASPSPSPTFNAPLHGSGPTIPNPLNKPLPTMVAASGTIAPGSGPSSLASRLKAFLPAIKSANAELDREKSMGTLESRNIENVGEGEEGSERYIEMNLGLGVLEEKDEQDSDSESDTSSTSDSDAEKDVMGKLKGQSPRERPGIQVVDDCT